MYKQTYVPDREGKSMALTQLIVLLPFVTNQYCLKIIIDDSVKFKRRRSNDLEIILFLYFC